MDTITGITMDMDTVMDMEKLKGKGEKRKQNTG